MLLSSKDVAETDEELFLNPSMLSYRIALYGMLRVSSCVSEWWVSLVLLYEKLSVSLETPMSDISITTSPIPEVGSYCSVFK